MNDDPIEDEYAYHITRQIVEYFRKLGFDVMYQIRNVFIHHRGFLKSTNRWHDKIRQFKIDYPDKAKYYCIKQKKNRDYIFLEKSWNAKSEELLTAVIQFATTRGYWNP